MLLRCLGIVIGAVAAGGYLVWRDLKDDERMMEALSGPIVAPHCAQCAKGAAYCRESKRA